MTLKYIHFMLILFKRLTTFIYIHLICTNKTIHLPETTEPTSHSMDHPHHTPHKVLHSLFKVKHLKLALDNSIMNINLHSTAHLKDKTYQLTFLAQDNFRHLTINTLAPINCQDKDLRSMQILVATTMKLEDTTNSQAKELFQHKVQN